jgi:pyruvate ferredoxin oxidoreductase gamma subunit
MAMTEIRWHGRGGQGAKTAATFLAMAAQDQGKHSQGFPEYGPERRGAPVRGYTRISEQPIRQHCAIQQPGIVIVLDPTLLDSPTAGVTAGTGGETVFIINSDEPTAKIAGRLGVTEGQVHCVNASLIAQESFGRPIPNIPMLGALAQVTQVLPFEGVVESLKKTFAKKYAAHIVDGNVTAIKRAFEEVV